MIFLSHWWVGKSSKLWREKAVAGTKMFLKLRGMEKKKKSEIMGLNNMQDEHLGFWFFPIFFRVLN